MKYGFDDEKMEYRIALEEKDIADAFEVKKMMQSRGWNVLQRYVEGCREEFFKAEDRAILNPAKQSVILNLVSKRGGYDLCFGLSQLIIDRAEKSLERQKEKEQKINQNVMGGELE